MPRGFYQLALAVRECQTGAREIMTSHGDFAA
jgi:hypothetical protein